MFLAQKNGCTYFLIALLSFFFHGISAMAQSTPDHADILGVQVQGSGCDMSKTSITLSPDLKDMSVIFDDYVAEIGQGTQAEKALRLQKDCQILVDINIPQGWQFAFKSIDYRGFVALPASAWALHRFSAIVPNAPIASMREAQIQGPFNDNYVVHTDVKPTRMVWSPCNQTQQRVTLLSQLSVSYFPNTTDRSIAQIVLDSGDASVRQSFGVEWRQCSSPAPNPRPPVYPPAPGPRPGPGRPGRY